MTKHFLFTIEYASGDFSFTEYHLLLASNLDEADTIAVDLVRGWYGDNDVEVTEHGWYDGLDIMWRLGAVYEVPDDFAKTAKGFGIMTLFNEGHVEVTE